MGYLWISKEGHRYSCLLSLLHWIEWETSRAPELGGEGQGGLGPAQGGGQPTYSRKGTSSSQLPAPEKGPGRAGATPGTLLCPQKETVTHQAPAPCLSQPSTHHRPSRPKKGGTELTISTWSTVSLIHLLTWAFSLGPTWPPGMPPLTWWPLPHRPPGL